MRSTNAPITSHHDRPGAWGMLVLSCTLAILTACREKPAEKSPAASGPAASRASGDGSGSGASPAPKLQPPSEPVAIPKPVDAEPVAPRPAAKGAAAPAAEIALKAADAEDDPATPDYLPKSGEVGRWVKIEPVRAVDPKALAEIVPLQDATRFEHFRLVGAAGCTYALPRDAGAGKPVQGHVLVIEGQTATDAFGLLTCQSASARTVNLGGQTRIDEDDGLSLHCWQGRAYVKLWSEPAERATLAELQPLLAEIVGRIEAGDAPELISAMPQDGLEIGRRWLVRHLGSLPPRMLGTAAPPDLEKASELLGLDLDTLMCIASYEVPQARGPNVVWVVRYPSETAAGTAYQQYSTFLANAVGPAWESTNMLRPRGTFLVGTWTSDEESLTYMMPVIERRLPRE